MSKQYKQVMKIQDWCSYFANPGIDIVWNVKDNQGQINLDSSNMEHKTYNFFNPVSLGFLTLLGIAFLVFQPKIHDSPFFALEQFVFFMLSSAFVAIYGIALVVFFIKGKRFSREKMLYGILISITILFIGYRIAYA